MPCKEHEASYWWRSSVLIIVWQTKLTIKIPPSPKSPFNYGCITISRHSTGNWWQLWHNLERRNFPRKNSFTVFFYRRVIKTENTVKQSSWSTVVIRDYPTQLTQRWEAIYSPTLQTRFTVGPDPSSLDSCTEALLLAIVYQFLVRNNYRG